MVDLKGKRVNSMRNEALKKKLDNNFLDFKGLHACKTFLEKYKEVKNSPIIPPLR